MKKESQKGILEIYYCYILQNVLCVYVCNLVRYYTRDARKHIHQVSTGSFWPLKKDIAQHEAHKFHSPYPEFHPPHIPSIPV